MSKYNEIANMVQNDYGHLMYIDDRGYATHIDMLKRGIKVCYYCGELNPIERNSCVNCDGDIILFRKNDKYYECR